MAMAGSLTVPVEVLVVLYGSPMVSFERLMVPTRPLMVPFGSLAVLVEILVTPSGPLEVPTRSPVVALRGSQKVVPEPLEVPAGAMVNVSASGPD